MIRRVMTPEKIERAVSLRRKSWSISAIAADLGASPGAVRWQLLSCGEIDPPKPTSTLRPVPTEPRIIRSGGRSVRMFTQAEDAQLLALEKEGLRVCEIARRLNRRWNSVLARLKTLARRDERMEATR